MRKTLGDFKAFLLRDNVVALAVAVVVGGAFSQIVMALVSDIITPLIGMIVPGGGFFGNRTLTIGSGPHPRAIFPYGHFLNTIITFAFVASTVFFFVVKPVNTLMSMHKPTTDVQAATKECPECLSSIPNKARRCAFCTATQDVADVSGSTAGEHSSST